MLCGWKDTYFLNMLIRLKILLLSKKNVKISEKYEILINPKKTRFYDFLPQLGSCLRLWWYLFVHLAISRGKRRQSRESKFNQKLPRLKPLRDSGVRRAPQILLFFLKAPLSKAFVKTREERNKFILCCKQISILVKFQWKDVTLVLCLRKVPHTIKLEYHGTYIILIKWTI